MDTEEPRGKQVNTCQLYSHLGNSSILACGASSCSQSDKYSKLIVMYVYSQPDKYINRATSKPTIILYHKI